MDLSTKKNITRFYLFCLLLCTLSLIPLFTVLSLSTANGSQVKATIKDLYAPVITYDSARNFLTIPYLSFFLSLYDDTKELNVYYDDITLEFYHVGSTTNTSHYIPIANYTMPGFYQKGKPRGSVAEFNDHVKTQGIISLDEVSKDASEIVLRVNLATAVRFQYYRKGEKHKLLVGADVKMSTITGKKVETGGLELSPYTEHGSGGHYKRAVAFCYCCLIFILVCFLFLMKLIEDGKLHHPRHKLSTDIRKFVNGLTLCSILKEKKTKDC